MPGPILGETYAQKKKRESEEMQDLRFIPPPAIPKPLEREVNIPAFVTPESNKPHPSTVGGIGVLPAPVAPPAPVGSGVGIKKPAIPVAKPVPKAGLTDLPAVNQTPGGLAAADLTSPIMAEGVKQLPAWAPTPEAPVPAVAPTLWGKAKGIAEGIGKWAEDPKIARALMAAGLQTLATEPRRVPFSNAEMLGRAGLAGIGAYDTEVAKEMAMKEMARKAGIEEREMVVKERVPKEKAEKRKVYTETSPSIGKGGKPVRVVRFEDTGEVAYESPLTPAELAKMRKEAKEGGEGGIDEWIIKKAAEVKAKTLEETGGDVEEANRRSSEFKTAVEKERQGARWQAAPEVEKLSWLESLFTKQPKEGTGRYVGGTQYTPEQIAAERKRRGL